MNTIVYHSNNYAIPQSFTHVLETTSHICEYTHIQIIDLRYIRIDIPLIMCSSIRLRSEFQYFQPRLIQYSMILRVIHLGTWSRVTSPYTYNSLKKITNPIKHPRLKQIKNQYQSRVLFLEFTIHRCMILGLLKTKTY